MPITETRVSARLAKQVRLIAAGTFLLLALSACSEDPETEPSQATPTAAGLPIATRASGTSESAGPSPQLDATDEPTAAGARPAATAHPDPSPSGSPPPTVLDYETAAAGFPVPPDRDFYKLARELIPGIGDVDPIVRDSSPTLEEGHRKTFLLVDLDARVLYESEFELRLVTPHAYWFVEDGVRASQENVEKSAADFEDNIYPEIRRVFGEEWTPGVDGDPHLYVVNAHLRGAGGYFSAADEYPRSIRPVSNEIEAIYTNARYLPIGSEIFSQVVAHELQHAIHWNHDRSEETWVNEGLSELAVTVAGYPEFSISQFRRAGPTSLTNWPADDIGGAENYGAASLFMNYLTAHYGGRGDLRPLLTEQADGIPGIDAYLEGAGYDARFLDVFRDWAIANLLDEDSGTYGHPGLDIRLPVYENLKSERETSLNTSQFATEYIRLEQLSSPAVLSFTGNGTAPLLPVDTGQGCWWSNRGDVIDSTLSASIDLKNAASPSLDYEVWYSIEEDWDFAYLEASVDGGETWTILETPLTSDRDPLQVSFGPGYTGASDGWRRESVSLRQWAGEHILVRFQYITDAAIHDHGLCLRDIRVVDGESGRELATEWTANGFIWTDNRVPQLFMLQVVYEGKKGSPNRVVSIALDGHNRAAYTIEPDTDARRVIAVVQPVAPATRLPSSYSLSLHPAN